MCGEVVGNGGVKCLVFGQRLLRRREAASELRSHIHHILTYSHTHILTYSPTHLLTYSLLRSQPLAQLHPPLHDRLLGGGFHSVGLTVAISPFISVTVACQSSCAPPS